MPSAAALATKSIACCFSASIVAWTRRRPGATVTADLLVEGRMDRTERLRAKRPRRRLFDSRLRVARSDKIVERWALQQRAVGASIAAEPDVLDTECIRDDVAMGVVGKTRLLVLLILRRERYFEALAGHFAARQRTDANQHRRSASVGPATNWLR